MAASRPSPSDAQRFEACFERCYADVARYCARRVESREDAEDAAIEVFATAWRRLGDLPPEPDDRLWLFGIARRVLANSRRSERRRGQLVRRLGANRAPGWAPPPGEGAAAYLAEALGALSDSDRELLLLTGWEGLRPAEIARVVGRPAPVVSRRLHRARRRLHAQLAALGASLPENPTAPEISRSPA